MDMDDFSIEDLQVILDADEEISNLSTLVTLREAQEQKTQEAEKRAQEAWQLYVQQRAEQWAHQKGEQMAQHKAQEAEQKAKLAEQRAQDAEQKAEQVIQIAQQALQRAEQAEQRAHQAESQDPAKFALWDLKRNLIERLLPDAIGRVETVGDTVEETAQFVEDILQYRLDASRKIYEDQVRENEHLKRQYIDFINQSR